MVEVERMAVDHLTFDGLHKLLQEKGFRKTQPAQGANLHEEDGTTSKMDRPRTTEIPPDLPFLDTPDSQPNMGSSAAVVVGGGDPNGSGDATVRPSQKAALRQQRRRRRGHRRRRRKEHNNNNGKVEGRGQARGSIHRRRQEARPSVE